MRKYGGRGRGWHFHNFAHGLAARGIKTKVELFPANSTYTLKRLGVEHPGDPTSDLGVDVVFNRKNYAGLIPRSPINLSARGKMNSKMFSSKPSIHIVSSEEYDNLPSEITKRNNGEMSYASTQIHHDGVIDVYIRDSNDRLMNSQLIGHELEELSIWRRLVKDGMNPEKACDVAHEMTDIKLRNQDVDKHFGDIGDPI